jgi:hypothetical protein
LANVTITFLGPLRLLSGVRTIAIEAKNIDEVREYVETHYRPVFQLKFGSHSKIESLWDHSQFLLNGRSLKNFGEPVLKDGDRLDWLITAAGG